MTALGDCDHCTQRIDGDSAAIGLSGDGTHATYIPFVEDLRSSGFRLLHPACFAAEQGIDALIGVVHDHDRKNRSKRSN